MEIVTSHTDMRDLPRFRPETRPYSYIGQSAHDTAFI
jgi:hypothetical protein